MLRVSTRNLTAVSASILCGDRKVAHKEIDLKDWGGNQTVEHFGLKQALRCRAASRDRAELGRNLRSLHVARRGRRCSHVILFAAGEEDRIVGILHDSMDLARHLPLQRDQE